MSGRTLRRSRKKPGRSAAFHALLAVGVACRLAACGGTGNPARSAEPALSYADGLVLVVDGNGLEDAVSGIATEAVPAYSAGFVAAVASSGSKAIAAINRSGAALLDIDERTRTLRIEAIPSGEFAGRTVGSVLADGDGSFLVSLYRHPDETGPDSGGSLLRLDASAAAWETASLPESIDASSVYAMHRAEDGRFLVATRRLDGERVVTSRWLVGPDGRAEAVSLADFERMLAPRQARSAPPALRAALEALAAETGATRILAFARKPRGDGAWYALGAGAPETTVEVVAALDASGTAAFAAFPAGPAKIAMVSESRVELRDATLETPVPGATWNGALIHGDSDESLVLLLSWWVERFPDAAASGLLIKPLAGSARASAL